jgi:isoaspartyl peptidase/L-asparaginase-like protein (Ntn-hydrolase superfamily)
LNFSGSAYVGQAASSNNYYYFGVYVDGGGVFNMSGGTVSNSATGGAGVYVNPSDGSTYNKTGGSAKMTHVTTI